MPLIALPQYLSVFDADEYFFNGRLDSEIWIQSSVERKQQALVTATRAIDRLRFVGLKLDATQPLEFPRNVAQNGVMVSLGTPQDVLMAVCEEALSRLDGSDPEFEMGSLNSITTAYAGVKDTYDRSSTVEWILAGIMSSIAWSMLRPYLSDPQDIQLSRV